MAMKQVKSTPDLLLKSASRDHNYSVISQSSALRSFNYGNTNNDDADDFESTSSSALFSSSQQQQQPQRQRSFDFQADPSFWNDHNVQVIIRVRPLSASEISTQGQSKCIRQESTQCITWTGHPESRFTFDLVADENVSQESLFKVAGVPMVENCVGGYNSCMFAYGQTGSGKTHTMLGDIEGGTRRHSVNCGMTPRVFEYLFSRIQKEKEARREEKLRFTCKCSFLEIYNEQILDLLDPSSINLQIREDIRKGVYVENLTEVEVTSARDVIQQLVQGAANRKVASTNMNRASSRSHSVFTCIIESTWEGQGVTHHRFARLNLVDLAGSERQKSSGAEGERLKEATNINKSLSTLGLVIMNLVSISNGKSLHVPYRDSKLTFLLQDSLGGNAKTIIIANISPSNCCSLETLSTLKFAQRAKFIKNHAIINEDASGDVLAMRIQIQNLKKEVSRLRGLVNGGAENNESDAWAVSFPGSPGSFNWEGLHGLSTPLKSDRKTSHKKDYEVALVGAFRREKEKDIALQALVAENQAAMQLAKQREDEIQGLKMRLRFREAGIKRLEAVASGKISAETHLLKEKEEHLKEIEVLRTQADRNQEVTRFAMENLRLKEEIRRLKSFFEDGERERMNEQIMILENKLLEALDWKLMHDSDSSIVQKATSGTEKDPRSEGILLIEESMSPWRSSINEENEFLRMQAIQNQSELDSLRKKLDFCVEEKEKLERQINDLIGELEVERSSRASIVEETTKEQNMRPSLTADQMPNINISDQIELETMVDAIAAASQREAQAHETAIFLSKENDELRQKLKILIEDNNKLIELYEQAVSSNKSGTNNSKEEETKYQLESSICKQEKEGDTKDEVDNLKHQLLEMHEENERLLALYEKAMKERDSFERLITSIGQRNVEDKGGFNCPEKLVEVDAGEHPKGTMSFICDAGVAMEETAPFGSDGEERWENHDLEEHTVSDCANSKLEEASLYEVHVDDGYRNTGNSSNMVVHSSSVDAVNVVKKKLDEAQEKLLKSAQDIKTYGSLERAILEAGKVSGELEELEDDIKLKQHDYESFELLASEIRERKVLVDKKLVALKYSLSCFSSSVGYFEQREIQAKAKLNTSLAYLNKKKEELASCQARKAGITDTQMKIKQSEVELRRVMTDFQLKLEIENKKLESDRVLFAIDNVEKTDVPVSRRNLQLSSKASDLLKSEEEKTKLQNQIKQNQEKLGRMKKETDDLKKNFEKLETEVQVLEKEIRQGLQAVEEKEEKLRAITREKETILEMKEAGRSELEKLILEYHECIFEAELKEEEMKLLEEELQMGLKTIKDLQAARTEATSRKSKLTEAISCQSCLVSDKVEEELHNIRMLVMELNTSLEDQNLHVS